jgi:succinoglycan biosynthesis protein ExoV
MQLFHFDKAPNYGDALNPWLWPRLLGEQLQASSPTLFLGIGTILKTDLPQAERYAVLSSGGGYGPFPKTDHRWNFYAVRGPLTAKALGLEPDIAAIDGAYLLRKFTLPEPVSAGPRIGFMPHWQTKLRVPWEKICAMSGLRYINPKLSVEETLAQLRGCDGIIAEAMHAAITADALRIRWMPVRLGNQFLDFKWRDWMGSIELAVDPIMLPSIHPRLVEKVNEGPFRRGYRRAVNSAAYALQSRALVSRLKDIRRKFEADTGYGHLSEEPTMQRHLSRLENALDRVRACET